MEKRWKTKKGERARKGFEYAVKQASKCRHEKYMVSCCACPEKPTCEIQIRLEKHKANLEYK